MIATLAQYKAFNQAANVSDSLLQLFLDSATTVVEGFLGYSVGSADYDETFDGNGSYLIQLNARPVTALTSITIDEEAQDVADFTTKGEILIKKDGENVFPVGRGNVAVVYTAGSDADGTGVGIPEVDPLILQQTYKIAEILKTDWMANGQQTVVTPDGSSRTLPSWINFDKQLEPLRRFRIERC